MRRLTQKERQRFDAMHERGERLDTMANALGVSVDAIKGRLYRMRHGHAKTIARDEPIGFGWESEKVDLRRRIWDRARRAAAEALRQQCQ